MRGNRLSICLSSAYYPPHMGGVEVFTQSIAREIAARGHEVCVVTGGQGACQRTPGTEAETARSGTAAGDGPGNPAQAPGAPSAADGVEVVRLPVSDPTGRFPFLKRDAASQRIWADFAAREFDAYVVNTRFYPLSLRMLGLARRKGARPILIEHGSSYLSLGNPALDLAIRTYEDAIGARIRALGPACYGVSREACAWLGRFGLEARGTIHNSIDAGAFRAASSGRDFRGEANIPADACLVAFTGRIIAEKGIWTLADAARQLEKRGYYFLVAGEGPELGKLQARKPSNLRLLGRLDRPDVAALLAQSDIFCFPSAYPEGLPTSLLEAACSQAYIVSAAVGGAREVVPGPDYGHIVEGGPATAYADAIAYAWEHRDAMRACAERCARRVEAEFSWARAADDLLAACGIGA